LDSENPLEDQKIEDEQGTEFERTSKDTDYELLKQSIKQISIQRPVKTESEQNIEHQEMLKTP
jgi:hypothetical protein